MRRIILSIKSKSDIKILKDFLRDEGFEIIVYDYKNSKKYKFDDFDLIISDEFCAQKCAKEVEKAKKLQKTFLPALCLISHKIKAETYFNMGFDDVIRYPTTKSEFLSRIKILLKLREQSERILREAEKKYQIIVEKSHAGILLIDENYRLVYVNDRVCEMVGRQRNEIIGHDFREFLAEDSVELVSERYVKRQRGEKLPDRYEFNIVRKGGEIRNVEIISSLIEDEEGKKFTIAQLLDITERKKAEEELKKSERFLKSIFHSIQDGISVLDTNLTIRMINWTMEQWYSKNMPLVGKKCYEAYHNRSHPCNPCPTIRAIKSGRREREIIPGLPGAPAECIELFVYPITDESGEVTGVVEFVRDITRLKKAEEELKRYTEELEKIVEQRTKELAESEKRYRTLVESPLVAFWEADAYGNFTLVNNRLVEMAGYSTKEEIVGKLNMLQCIVPEQRDWLMSRMVSRRRGEKTEPDIVEAELLKKDGSRFNVIASPASVYDEKGKLVNIVGAMIDITDMKKLEKEIIEKNKELESFAFTVSHDLRAPLRGMHGFANALIEDYGEELNESARFYAERIVRAAEDMDELIRDLLEYSRIGRTDLRLQRLKSELILEQVIRDLYTEINKKKAKINIEKPMPDVKADKNFLYQVFLNLISNAIKFVEEDKTPEVKIWAEEENDFVRFWIEDNGIGISEEYHKKIFNVFEKLHGIEKYPGTGIGLAIVKRCVQKMGGKIGVISQERKGSKFWFEILKVP